MTKKIVTCSLENCINQAKAKGMCFSHYQKNAREQRKLDPNTPACAVDGCSNPSMWRSWCIKHYERWHSTGSPTGLKRWTEGESFEDRFWFRVARQDDDKCWEWQGFRNKGGYGTVGYKGQVKLTHRIAFMLTTGKMPTKMILHKCDNPPCCNPNHLTEGDNRRNMRDMVEKGRSPGRIEISRECFWQAVSDLTEGLSLASVARTRGLTDKVVWNIKNGTHWGFTAYADGGQS